MEDEFLELIKKKKLLLGEQDEVVGKLRVTKIFFFFLIGIDLYLIKEKTREEKVSK